MDLNAIELMQATNHPPFSRAGWIFEFKYDGYRVLASKDQLLTRNKKDATTWYPEIVQALHAVRGSPDIPGAADGLLRALYIEGIGGELNLRELLQEREEFDAPLHERQVFAEEDGVWKPKLAA